MSTEPATSSDRAALELVTLAKEIASCALCDLSSTRTQTVPGEGSPTAPVVFVGEAPGAREDRTGRPFAGASGRLLDDLLASIAMRRTDVYIVNTVKCRPPDNRNPRPAEIAACAPFLERQLRQIQPRVIATLGRFALSVFAPEAQLGEVHGRPFAQTLGPILHGATLFPLYHPAAALHNGSLRPTLERDMAALGAFMAMLPRDVAGEATLRQADSGSHGSGATRGGEAE